MTEKPRSNVLDPNALLQFSFCYPFLCRFGGRIMRLPVGRVTFACYSSSWRYSLICLA